MEDRVIANIIYKELFSYNPVYLQDIGYISLVSHNASLSSDGSTLTPPYKTIGLFPVDSVMDSYVDLIMAMSQYSMVDYSTAYAMYSNFISSHIMGNILNLPMVMTINLDDLSILRLDERIINALEGQDLSSIQVAPRGINSNYSNGVRQTFISRSNLSSTPGALMITIASVILFTAVSYIAYYFYFANL